MGQFAGFNWPNIVSTNGDHRHCPSATINELDLAAATTLVNMHNGPGVSAVELFMRRIAIQYDEGMFGNHLPSSG